MNEETFLTTAEAASRLRVGPWTIVAWIHAGSLKAVRAGHKWLIRQSDLDAFLSRR